MIRSAISLTLIYKHPLLSKLMYMIILHTNGIFELILIVDGVINIVIHMYIYLFHLNISLLVLYGLYPYTNNLINPILDMFNKIPL